MFLAYSNLDLAQNRQKKRLDRTEKREDYRNSNQQRRYKAGQRPDWDDGEDSEDEGKRYIKATSNAPVRRNQLNPKHRQEYVPPVAEVVPRNRRRINVAKVIETKRETRNSDNSDNENIDRHRSNRSRTIAKPSLIQDDRLSRLENFSARRNHENRTRNRRRHETSSSEDSEKQVDSDMDEEDMRNRRARLLAKREVKKAEVLNLKKYDDDKKYENERVIVPDSDESELSRESESEEEESESEESESEEDDLVPKLRPVFMKKDQRVTLEDEEDVAQRAENLEKETKQKADERRAYTLSLVENEIQREKEEQDFKDTKIALHDVALQMARINTDDSDEERAFGQWKQREFDRLKREKTIRDEEIAKEEALARRREMHESELVHEAFERKQKQDAERENNRKDHKFLQRYYHGGIFYKDDDKLQDLIKARADAPTLEDHFDRSKLPEIYQNKYFGKRSNVKHTHLSKEDTSRKDAWGHNMEEDRRGNRPQKPR